MRTPMALSIGWTAGVIAGVCLTTASIADDQQSTETASESANDAEPVAESVTRQIENLESQFQEYSRSGFELLIRTRGLQGKRPRVTAGEDSAERAERQKNLAQWISDIEAMRSELRDHQAKLDAVSDQIRSIRKRDMTDAEVTELVNYELGIHRVILALQRGIRELDAAWRRGANALDDRAG
ncbi:MAG: hypothetical protein AAEJ52_17810 [Myxococcota bacterium]